MKSYGLPRSGQKGDSMLKHVADAVIDASTVVTITLSSDRREQLFKDTEELHIGLSLTKLEMV